jgi:hypothetical protein
MTDSHEGLGDIGRQPVEPLMLQVDDLRFDASTVSALRQAEAFYDISGLCGMVCIEFPRDWTQQNVETEDGAETHFYDPEGTYRFRHHVLTDRESSSPGDSVGRATISALPRYEVRDSSDGSAVEFVDRRTGVIILQKQVHQQADQDGATDSDVALANAMERYRVGIELRQKVSKEFPGWRDPSRYWGPDLDAPEWLPSSQE